MWPVGEGLGPRVLTTSLHRVCGEVRGGCTVSCGCAITLIPHRGGAGGGGEAGSEATCTKWKACCGQLKSVSHINPMFLIN